MKFKIMNTTSLVCFVVSTSNLLLIPFLNFENNDSEINYYIAGLFWIGIIVGTILQSYLWMKSHKLVKVKDLKKAKGNLVIIFIVSLLFDFLFLNNWGNNIIALSISLFVTLLSVEVLLVVKRMEKIL